MTKPAASAPPAADALQEVVAEMRAYVAAGDPGWPEDMIGAWADRLAASAQVREVEPVTVDNAPIGTRAPAIDGGHWFRMSNGWKWNGPAGGGNTYPRPGGDWSGKLIVPAPEPAPVAQVIDEAIDRIGSTMPHAPLPGSIDAYILSDWFAIVAHIQQQQATIADHARIVAELRESAQMIERESREGWKQAAHWRAVAEVTEASLAACRADALLLALERAAKELPDGWQIHLTVEHGSAWVTIEDENGKQSDPSPDHSLAEAVHEGIDAAMAVLPLAGEVANG